MLQWATILLCKLLSSLGLVFLLSLVAVDDFLLHYVVKFSCLSIFLDYKWSLLYGISLSALGKQKPKEVKKLMLVHCTELWK